MVLSYSYFCCFNDTATTESYTYVHTLPLPDALPIYGTGRIQRCQRILEEHRQPVAAQGALGGLVERQQVGALEADTAAGDAGDPRRQQAHHRQRGDRDRKSTRLNSSH